LIANKVIYIGLYITFQLLNINVQNGSLYANQRRDYTSKTGNIRRKEMIRTNNGLDSRSLENIG